MLSKYAIHRNDGTRELEKKESKTCLFTDVPLLHMPTSFGLVRTEHIQFNHRGRVWEIQLRNEQGDLVEENDGVRQIRHHYLHMAGFNMG